MNGPAGVGKTTVSEALALRSKNSVVIHGDYLADAIKRKTTPVIEGRLGYKAGALLSGMYADAGFDLVIFEYIFETGDHYSHFMKHYRGALPVRLVTLWAPLDIVMSRESSLVGRSRLGDRVAACHRVVTANLDALGVIVDASVAEPTRIAQQIETLVAPM